MAPHTTQGLDVNTTKDLDTSTVASQESAPTYSTTLFVSNIHCPSCTLHIRDILRPKFGIHKVDVSIINHTVTIEHLYGLEDSITNALLKAAFEVRHVSTCDTSGRIISSRDLTVASHKRSHRRWLRTKEEKQHIANCEACQLERSRSTLFSSNKRRRIQQPIVVADVENGNVEPPAMPQGDSHNDATGPQRYITTISITGMTCASCSNGVTNGLKGLDFVDDVQVNLLSNSAKVTFTGDVSNTQKIAEEVEDLGFEAAVAETAKVQPQTETASQFQAKFTIQGMTCGSCVAHVTNGLKELEGVLAVNVDLVGSCAVVRYDDRITSEQLVSEIEDLGFDCELIEEQHVQPTQGDSSPTIREVQFEIVGMYCPKCPLNIMQNVADVFHGAVLVDKPPAVDRPFITLSYTPDIPQISIRQVKSAIDAADPAITASVYRPPSLEERSRTIQRKEGQSILRHLLFTFAIAIPSFIIGVVFMSLVPSTNHTRRWLEQPMWAGMATRMDWAMLLMTTPAMLYGASIFHIRALREIWALWKPGSRVPILRRFYRFGSMNLLISAGTSVAYFSSVAILIMEASTPRTSESMKSGRSSTTYFDTVTFLTLFILCGKYLQAYSKAKTGDAVAMLGKLRPSEAQLVECIGSGEEEKTTIRTIPIDLLEIGDIISIPHGASPPTDGVVEQDGSFLFDESSLTGESKPVSKSRGDAVLTGSVNSSDPVRVKVTELGGNSMLDQIISVVRDGQAKRAPVERVADLLTSYFTPIITLIAILTWIIWLALGESGALPAKWLDVQSGGWAFWSVEFAIAVFVVACPCGLGLAAPTALFVGGGLAAREGILVQGGGEAFQEASQLDTIVFDKTGTLTEGQMRVTDMEVLSSNSNVTRALVQQMSRQLEEASTHPIARAIVQFCEAESAASSLKVTAEQIKEVPGQGMTGKFTVHDRETGAETTYEAVLGNERILSSSSSAEIDEKHAATVTATPNNTLLTQTLAKFQSQAYSTAIFALRKITDSDPNLSLTPSAVFAITDPIRPEAHSVLTSLRALNISIHMCTGDNPATAHAIARQLSIPPSNVRAGVLPQEKASYITSLQSSLPSPSSRRQRSIVAFVGDGTNDTPALTTADVSIALSSSSDIALTTSSFILLNNNLTTILSLIRLSKRVFFRVKLNFAWAAVYNLCLVPVAAGVFFPLGRWRLSPVWASAAMAGSSVSVVLSSLALRLPESRFQKLKLWNRGSAGEYLG